MADQSVGKDATGPLRDSQTSTGASAAAVMSVALSAATAHAEPPSPPPSPPPPHSPLDMPTATRAITPRPAGAGALAEPASHESAPGAQSCRLAFPSHMMLLVLIVTLSTSVLLLTSNLASGIRELCMALVAVGCATLGVGSVSHLAQLVNENRRKSSELRRLVQEKLQLEERNEQLQAEKERLLYDVLSQQHLCRVLGRHPLDEEGRSAISRGLRGLGPPSEAGGPAPSDSLPPSLPPGPPSSSASSASDCCKSETESTSDSFKSEDTSCLPSSPPLRRQRVTALSHPAAAEASFCSQSSELINPNPRLKPYPKPTLIRT